MLHSINKDGNSFLANLPTEEVFTAPLKTGVNGTVASTKPLSYNGNIIDEFTITFKDGKIVDYSAKVGEASLKQLVELDEGSHYLGEEHLFLMVHRFLNRVYYFTIHCLMKMHPIT